MKLRKLIITLAVVMAIVLTGFVAARHPLVGNSVKQKIVAAGAFHNVAHKGEGRATVYQMMSGERLLYFTDFQTGEGRDLEVYLISAPDAFENETVEKSERLLLGVLQKTAGDQSYRLPDAVDLHRFRAVTVWSAKYRVNFTTAPLRAP